MLYFAIRFVGVGLDVVAAHFCLVSAVCLSLSISPCLFFFSVCHRGEVDS